MKNSNKRINLIAPISNTGYGVAGWNIYKSLSKMGYEIALQTRGDYDRNEKPEAQKGIDNLKHFGYTAPCLSIWHQYDLSYTIGKGKYSALTFFELDMFNAIERHSINYPDQIFVSSNWGKEIVEKYRRKDTFVVPLGIDPEIFTVEAQPTGKKNYIFFNAGKWEIRKGHDVLCDIFNKAFTPDDNVELWLLPATKYFNDRDNQKWSTPYLTSKMGLAGKIKILPWQSQDNLVKIMQYIDCGIFPNRAEGWNLELLEVMCVGKPVITTNYSAHTEFCNEHNSYLVPFRKLERAYDGIWFHGQGHWMKIDNKEIDLFIDYMRNCYNNNIHTNKYAVENTRNQFTWKNTAKIISELI